MEIDQAAGALMPFFDPDSNLLYLAGKVGRVTGVKTFVKRWSGRVYV